MSGNDNQEVHEWTQGRGRNKENGYSLASLDKGCASGFSKGVQEIYMFFLIEPDLCNYGYFHEIFQNHEKSSGEGLRI